MIKDLPTPEQFEQVAIDLLNLAWTSAADLTHNLNVAREGWDDDAIDREITDDYWKAAQRPLATAISLVQQAMEFLLKARIATVSPYLLLTDEWPRGCDARDATFSEFKTIDANELIRMHNTVIPTRLDQTFVAFFNELRQLRNTATHSLIADRRFSEREIFVSILKTNSFLLAPKTWIEIRRAYLDRDPIAVTHSTDFSAARLAQDITVAIDVMTPADTLTYFGFDKRSRAYCCPACIRRCAEGELGIGEAEPRLAQLIEKNPECTQAKCVLCRGMIEVTRGPCAHEGCPGNVIEKYNRVCMTCNRYQPGAEPTSNCDH